ncbi:TPA: MFS transporter [Candidatus Bathyarchaeota archaeon]|nr:MFS transporter [Candidatus Bathyarchaeota archaeon]
MWLGSYRGLHREARYLIYAALLPSVAYGMLYTDLPYFLTNIQGLSDSTMGFILAVMGVSMVGASILLGIGADKYGRRKVLVAGNIVASATLPIFALTANPMILIIAAILQGISEGASSAATGALLADKCDDTRRNSAFALSAFVGSTAFAVGSASIYFVEVFQIFGLDQKGSYVLLFIILAALSGASTLIMLKITESKSLKRTEARIRDLLPQKSGGVLAKYVLTGATIAFGAGLVVPLMTRWFDLRYGVPDTVSGLLLAVTSFVIGVATLAAPYLARKFGLVKAVVATQSISMLFMLATPMSPYFIIAGAIYTVRAFLMNMSSPLQQSMIMGLVRDDERGAASGISSAFWRLPNAISAWIGASMMGIGLLYEPFYLATIFYGVSIIMFWFFFRRTKMPEENVA